MVKVVIDVRLQKKLEKKFNKAELNDLKQLFLSLQDNPFQGDFLHTFGSFVLKEKKYKSFRFYFLHSKKLLVIKDIADLKDEVIRFIEMSKKNNQQRVIDKLKNFLKALDRKK